MALIDEVTAVAQSQGQAAAIAIVERRANDEDGEALALIGQWRLWGVYGPRDLAAGYAALAAAAAQGQVDAALTLSALLVTGTGTQPDATAARQTLEKVAAASAAARAQLKLIATAPPAPAAIEILRGDPRVARVAGLLSTDECEYLIAQANPQVRPSTVIDPASGRRIANPVRDSFGWTVSPPLEDMVLHAINQRIAAVTGTRSEQGEPLHLLRYFPGQQYRPHYDALPGVRNQRVLTAIVYLNGEYSGGETAFDGGPIVKGRPGDAIVFANTDATGRADPRTRHAGLPVKRGIKWIATRWIRAHPFDPWTTAS